MATKKTTKTTKAATPTKEEIAVASKKPEVAAPKKSEGAKESTKVDGSAFAVYNFAGVQKDAYVVDRWTPPSAEDSSSKKREVAHNIVVVDRSGSMYSSMDDLRKNLIKLFILDEYANAEQLVTLISYSSQGDTTIHLNRVELSKLNNDKKYQAEIQKLQVTGLTCISQGLKVATDLTNPNELTAISLHSDGYANDPSPLNESRELEKVCADLKAKSSRVFVNTIAYTNYADFQLLSKIANLVSGACVKAARITDVYSTLANTAIKLAAGAGPVHEEPLGDYDFQVFVSKSAKRINGAAGPLKLSGINDDDDKTIYKFKKDPKASPSKELPREAMYAFTRALLSTGQLNLAKLVLHSTGNTTLARHTRALSAEQVTAFALALDEAVFTAGSYDFTGNYNLVSKIAVLDLVAILEKHKRGIEVDIEHLRKIYQRRGVKRLQGERDEAGNVKEPWLKTEPVDKSNVYVPVTSFDLNRNAATINMNVSQPVRLVQKDNGKVIEQVAGVKLDSLRNFFNYTLVGDGMLNVSELKVKISEELFNELKPLQVLLDEDTSKAPESYSKDKAYLIALDDLPVIAFSGRFESLDGLFEKLAQLKTVSSILSAHLKEESDKFTAEQIEELKKHYLSKSLFLNFPTTNPYTDLQEAIAKGEIDSRTSYKVDVGTAEITSLGKLYSGNKLLDRFYEAYDLQKGEVLKDDLSYAAHLEGKIGVRAKKLSARTKIGPVDNLQKPFLDAWINGDFSEKSPLGKLLREAGCDGLIAAAAKRADKAEWVKEMTVAMKKIDGHSEKIFREKVAPVVFFIGSTGLLPDEFDAAALTADQVEGKYPELKLSKDEREGLFFEVGKTLLSVYPKIEYFSR
jgi:Mg-chelatase subunit ChlD